MVKYNTYYVRRSQTMAIQYVKVSGIKTLVKSNNKRVSKDFIDALDRHIRHKVQLACQVYNGGKKTLDATIAGFVGLKG